MVVSNTSPLINLAAIGLLNLLPQLYTTITIPPAVHMEITVTGRGLPGATEGETADWIHVQSVTNTVLVTTLLQQVNPGEAEAIALSVESSAQLLLIDERKGRSLANAYGLSVAGIIGVLSLAKERTMIPSVRPALNDLRRFGFWINQNLYDHVLRQEGEA
jgi:hypothetical protein